MDEPDLLQSIPYGKEEGCEEKGVGPDRCTQNHREKGRPEDGGVPTRQGDRKAEETGTRSHR
jgi:hypothetical protein